MKTVGILALQGDFAAHEKRLKELGAEPVQIREARQFGEIDGLIIPGGESTTMLKLLQADGMMEALKKFAAEKPVFGTCAGAILLAKTVENPVQQSLGALDIEIERNAYGRQRESAIAEIELVPEFARSGSGAEKMEAVFIRAPAIRKTGSGVKILARYKGEPVFVEQSRHLAATFHPELTGDARVHALFLGKL